MQEPSHAVFIVIYRCWNWCAERSGVGVLCRYVSASAAHEAVSRLAVQSSVDATTASSTETSAINWQQQRRPATFSLTGHWQTDAVNLTLSALNWTSRQTDVDVGRLYALHVTFMSASRLTVKYTSSRSQVSSGTCQWRCHQQGCVCKIWHGALYSS